MLHWQSLVSLSAFLSCGIVSSRCVNALEITVLNMVGAASEKAQENLYVLKNAENVLRHRNVIGPNITFRYIQSYVANDYSSGVGIAAQRWCREPYHVIVGMYYSKALYALAEFAAFNNIPVYAHLSFSGDFTDKTIYQTLVNLSPSSPQVVMATNMLTGYFGWKRLSIIGQHSVVPDFYLDLFKSTVAQDIVFPVDFRFNASTNLSSAQLQYALQQAKQTSRVILLGMGSNPGSARRLMLQARAMNMTNGEFVFIIPELYVIDSTQFPWQNLGGDDGLDAAAMEAFKAAIMLWPSDYSVDSVTKFKQRIQQAIQQDNQTFVGNNYGSLLSDAMLTYGIALNQCLQEDRNSYKNGLAMFNCSKLLTFKRAGEGRTTINDNGDRSWTFKASAIDVDGNFTSLLFIDPSQAVTCERYSNSVSIVENSSCIARLRPLWFAGGTIMPLDAPLCGFDGENCGDLSETSKAKKDTTIFFTLLVVVVVIVVILGGGHLYRSRLAKRKEVERILSVVRPATEVKLLVYRSASRGSQDFESTHIRSISAYSYSNSSALTKQCEMRPAVVKGEPALVKQYLSLKDVELRPEQLKLLHLVTSLNHENVGRFLGVMLNKEEQSICFLWSDPGLKGSLKAICENKDMELDATFKASLIRDIIAGLLYISKSPIGFHGCLNPVTCLVTNRWMVKLSSFGIKTVTAPLFASHILEVDRHEEAATLPYLAPELRSKTSFRYSGSLEADIYALAAVIYVIYYRLPADINKHASIARISEEADERCTWACKMLKLVPDCWAHEASKRPTIAAMKSVIETQTVGFVGKNLVDHMFSMMEKYANNLETVVQERTQQLEEERFRADRLLNQMLPPTIAEQLKQGKPVLPESFDSVTVYFSDIVGFTEISSRSSAIEVVDMLNSLYQQFDERIQLYDCYKVETIGDAYLVVSGAPRRNGSKHVLAVADMAHDICLFVRNGYRIPHSPADRVSIRIGFHSGPIAAGVVGFTAPRYCLFGDTVNVASRMESNGQPDRIHISWSSFELLQQHDYKITPRGSISIKGE